MKNVAFIPVRSGSTRLKLKALEKIGDESLLSIALKKAKLANVFDEIICMGDSDSFKEISHKNKIKYYERESINASNSASSEEVVLEAIKKTNGDFIYWINITHPFSKISTIKSVVDRLSNSDETIDSIFTAHSWLSHASLTENLNRPINFQKNDSFARTQTMEKIILLTYGIMAWNASSFLERYNFHGSAMLNGNIGTFDVNRLESIWIKNQSDLDMVNKIISKKNILEFL